MTSFRLCLLLLAACLAGCAAPHTPDARGAASAKRTNQPRIPSPPTAAELAEMHAFRDRPPRRPAEPVVRATVETERMIVMPDTFAVAMSEHEVLIGSYRGLRAGFHPCLRFMRLTKHKLHLIMKSGCLRDAALAGLARSDSRWLVLHEQLSAKGGRTNRFAVSVLGDGGTRLEPATEIEVRPFRAIGPRGTASLHKDIRLVARRGGGPLLLWSEGSHTRAAILKADGRLDTTHDLGAANHHILGATWAGDRWLVLRRSQPAKRWRAADPGSPLMLTSLAPNGAVSTRLLHLGTVRGATLIARSARASLLYRDDDKGEWLLPLDGRAEPIALDVHPYQGTFGPAASLGSSMLLLHADYGPRHAHPDRTPLLFSLVGAAGQTLAERVPLGERGYYSAGALYSDGNEAVAIWKSGERLERFGVAHLEGPQRQPTLVATPEPPPLKQAP